MTTEDYAAMYGKMHRDPKKFSGWSIKHYVDRIADLVRDHDAETLLDYGSGKGYQYLAKRVHERWGGILPVCYDPGVPQLSEKPKSEEKFDGVICTDVMEHVHRNDVPVVLREIFSYAERFVFLGIACRPAKRKRLPDGRDVHLTVEPPQWWCDEMQEQLSSFQKLHVVAVFELPNGQEEGREWP